MSERSLAHIERVVDIQPIDGADRIECVTVLGWQVVTRKGECKVGDLVCYIEIDSIVPSIDYFKFMEERKYRVKTIKLKKQISQGLIIPMGQRKDRALFPVNLVHDLTLYSESDDVTGILDIKKYESPSDRAANEQVSQKKIRNPIVKFLTKFNWYRKLTKTKSKSFPDWISKTDEPRIQSCPKLLTQDNPTCKRYYVTEKLDGQSATYWYKKKSIGFEFGICSRTVRKFELDNSNWSQVARDYNLKEKLKKLGLNIAIQGEIIGPRIQGGMYNNAKGSTLGQNLRFYVFNVYNIDTKKYYDLASMITICDRLGLDTVPILDTNYKPPETVGEMIKYASGRSTLADCIREGVVVRAHDKSVSFKAVSNEYLLKHEGKDELE